jgi:hypothetical protein
VTGVPVGSVVSSARLRLVVVNDSKAGGSVYGMTNTSWAENVTWNSRPAADGPLLASLGSVALNAVLDVDVTTAVTGNGKYSFAIVAPTSSTDTVGYASREASVATRPQLIVGYRAASAATAAPTATSTPTPANTPTLTAGATATPTPTATGTPMSTALATNTPTRTPTTASTSTSTPTQGTTPTATPSSGTRIKDITFEGSSLTDPISGADSVVGTVAPEMSKPLKGTTSAWVKNAGSSYVEERFSAVDDLFVSFYVRVNAIPTSSTGEVRIALISNAGSSVGNLVLRVGGALRLRNGSNTVGADSTPLTAGQVYRVGLRQRRGTGANAILEAYLASGEAAFGQPFASLSNGTWTTAADRLHLGTTISAPLDAVFDDIRLDRGVMP